MLTIFTIGGPLANASFANESTQLKYSTDRVMVDRTPVEKKSVVREALDGFISTKANPVNTSNVDLTYTPIVQNITGKATSQSTVMEDFIRARVRVYKNGGLISSGTNEERKSKYAGKSVTVNELKSGVDAYGNHEYKLAGYKDVYHETYTKF